MAMRGRAQHIARLRRMHGPELGRRIGRALFAAGEKVQVEAQISITTGSVSGAEHVPSKPGEPPNNDTGVLAGNIETTQPSPLLVEVSSNAPYSGALEFGTSRMAARPFMAPARDKMRPEIRALVDRAINSLTRGR